MTGFIYMVTNNITGKRYVGKTSTTVEERWKGHVSEASRNLSNSALHKAINKYGQDAFSLTVLLKNIPVELLNHYERLLIVRMKTRAPLGYNLTDGGDGVLGYHHTEQMRRHLSKVNNGRKLNHGDLIRAGWKRNDTIQKRSQNPLWRQHLSESRIGKYTGKENGFYGKHHSDDTKKHLSELRGLAVEMLSRQGEYLRTFCSAKAAGDYMVSEGLTSNKYANSLILDACRGKVSYAYGFCWRFHESVETNCKPEDELPVEAQRISAI